MTDVPSHADPVSIVIDHDDRTVDAESLTDLVHAVVSGEGKTIRHINIVCSNHDTVRTLNQEYLDHDYNTDVLSFSLADSSESAIEGEVYIDLDTAAERHEEFGSTYETEVGRYVAHGVLHLTGYDDATDEAKQRMHDLEDLYLRQAGWSLTADGRS